MSTKRTSADEKTNEFSDLEFQRESNAKRAKLVSLSETTLQDLPIELLEDILIKAAAMEVKDMKLAKKVWREKADLVISRLRTVCESWNSVLSSNFLQNKVHRILEDTAQEKIRFELLQQSLPINFAVDVAALKDEMFVLLKMDRDEFSVGVHDRNDLNMVKEVIPLPGCNPPCLAACNVSNCVYFLTRQHRLQGSVCRIARDVDQQFRPTISVLIDDIWLPDPTLCLTATGDLIISRQRGDDCALISIYNARGFLQHEVKLSKEICGISQIIQKANGNLVLVSREKGSHRERYIKEVDLNGTLIRQVSSSEIGPISVCHADKFGRLLITERFQDEIVVLDSEFNLLNFTCPQLGDNLNFPYDVLHYDAEKNEIVCCSVSYEYVPPLNGETGYLEHRPKLTIRTICPCVVYF